MSNEYGYTEDVLRKLWARVGDLPNTYKLLMAMSTAAEQELSRFLEQDNTAQSDPFADETDGQSVPEAQTAEFISGLKYLDTDYLPPMATRAGQFARLERQGKRREALEGEARIAKRFKNGDE
jgi:hypothetical protein